MESRIQDVKSPVITMKTPAKEIEVRSKKVPDITLRKQLLAKKNLGHSQLRAFKAKAESSSSRSEFNTHLLKFSIFFIANQLSVSVVLAGFRL